MNETNDFIKEWVVNFAVTILHYSKNSNINLIDNITGVESWEDIQFVKNSSISFIYNESKTKSSIYKKRKKVREFSESDKLLKRAITYYDTPSHSWTCSSWR